MLSRLYKFLDFFLPDHLDSMVEVSTFYRARLVVAANLAGVFIVICLFIGSFYLNLSLFLRIGIFTSILALSSLNIFLKTRYKNFERSLFIGSLLQVTFLFTIVNATAFSEQGGGFFGLMWLIPVFLMIAFYFRPRPALIIFTLMAAAVSVIVYLFYSEFFNPINRLPNFREVYLVFYVLVMLFCFLQSFLFVQLNIHLQRELSKQKDILMESAKFQSLGQMASNLAHDINNPLFTIQGKLHQIRNLFSKDQLDLEKCDQIIENVEGTILRLSQIVKGISTFARQGRGDQMVSVGAKDLLEGILLIASDRINQNKIKLTVKIPDTARVICYPSFISQILLNLLNNAIDALEYSDDKRIEVELLHQKEWIDLCVRDSGPGIPKEIEEKVFEPFFTTKKFGKGTGLGLSISKGLIETHEGTLSYRRNNNMTSFVIRLPSYE
jgi:signal transduction histidine kinase